MHMGNTKVIGLSVKLVSALKFVLKSVQQHQPKMFSLEDLMSVHIYQVQEGKHHPKMKQNLNLMAFDKEDL